MKLNELKLLSESEKMQYEKKHGYSWIKNGFQPFHIIFPNKDKKDKQKTKSNQSLIDKWIPTARKFPIKFKCELGSRLYAEYKGNFYAFCKTSKIFNQKGGSNIKCKMQECKHFFKDPPRTKNKKGRKN